MPSNLVVRGRVRTADGREVQHARVVAFDPLVEEQVVLEVGGVRITAFAGAGLSAGVGEACAVAFALFTSDGLAVEEASDAAIGVTQVPGALGATIVGDLDGDVLDAGVRIQDAWLGAEYAYLAGQRVRVRCDRLDVSEVAAAEMFEITDETPATATAVLCDAICDKADLMVTLAAALDFPDYFGANWDALFDCLCDLSWRQEAPVLIDHPSLPSLGADFASYIECLADAIARRQAHAAPPLRASFRSRDVPAIARIRLSVSALDVR